MIFPLLLDYQKPGKRYLEELLTVLNLKDRRNHLPSQLSGGQQQRVAIGRALITRPSLILADEPTGNLDSQNSSEVIALLKETSKKYEQTIIMITHNRSIAQTADRVLQSRKRLHIKELRSTIANLNETIDELKRKIFGTSSEKTRRPDQEEGIQEEETVTVVKEHTRTRRKKVCSCRSV